MDTERIRQLAESSQRRAQRCHADYQRFELGGEHTRAVSAQNDYFYWIGHANAYKGVIAMIELQTVVEDERDAEGSCP